MRVVVRDRRAALVGGVLAIAFGSWLLSQAYDARGKRRPLPVRALATL